MILKLNLISPEVIPWQKFLGLPQTGIFDERTKAATLLTWAVSSLFTACRPSHVADFVMSVVVDAVKRVIGRRSGAYFSEELLKGIKQKLNSPSPIAIISVVMRLCATILGVMISAIFWRLISSVPAITSNCSLDVQAPTGLCVSVDQVSSLHIAPRAATTPDQPMNLNAISSENTKDGQSLERLPRQVAKVMSGRSKWTKWCGKFDVSHVAKESPFVNVIRAVRGVNYLVRPVSILAQNPYKTEVFCV